MPTTASTLLRAFTIGNDGYVRKAPCRLRCCAGRSAASSPANHTARRQRHPPLSCTHPRPHRCPQTPCEAQHITKQHQAAGTCSFRSGPTAAHAKSLHLWREVSVWKPGSRSCAACGRHRQDSHGRQTVRQLAPDGRGNVHLRRRQRLLRCGVLRRDRALQQLRLCHPAGSQGLVRALHCIGCLLAARHGVRHKIGMQTADVLLKTRALSRHEHRSAVC